MIGMAKVRKQFIRYIIVGLASNATAYLFYIVLTRLGFGPKVTMSFIYGIGVMQTFIMNKRWTFECKSKDINVLLRYCSAYGLGYFINIMALIVFVDDKGYPHEIVQGIMIFLLALLLFVIQKFWVFPMVNLRGGVENKGAREL